MERFIVKKNTLPYVHQWAVLGAETGNKVGEYKTKQLAEEACKTFNQYGLPDNINQPPDYWGSKTAWDIANNRMKHPEDNLPPQPPRHSDKRPVELD